MKKKILKVILMLVFSILALVGIMGTHKENAIDIIEVESIYNEYANNLKKYEMVFVYPKSQKEEIEKIKNELRQIYNSAQDKLLVTYMEYDKSDCKNSIISDIELQGDISYRSIVFVYTNSEMCDNIQFAMQNATSSASKHKEGFARQKIITIPVDSQAKKSMEEWDEERKDWFNYEYTANTSEAIEEMYSTLNITKEEVAEANKEDNSTGQSSKEENEQIEDKEEKTLEYKNEDIKIKHQVQSVQIVLSNGMIVNPDNIETSEIAKTISLNSSTMHGAKVYIQYKISAEKNNSNENVEISNVKISCKNNKLTYNDDSILLDENKTNKNQGWKQDDDGTLTNIIKLGGSVKIVGYQVITNGMELIYENQITDVEYQKKTVTTNPDGTLNEEIETIKNNDIIKSDMIKIEEAVKKSKNFSQ